MRNIAILLAVFALLFAFGCASKPSQPSGGTGTIVGNDRDAHGCIGSAGYSWCEPLQKCIRPWEENCTASSPQEGAMPGSDRDEHGCIGSAGYTWCDSLQKCIRPWEENCTEQLVGGDRDEHGCIGSAGYQWCPEKSKCLQVWEEDCPSLSAKAFEEQAISFCANGVTVYTCGQYIKVVSSMPGAGSEFYTLGNYDPIKCPVVAPEYMTEQCRMLLLGNNCAEQKVDCSIITIPAAVNDLKDDPSFVGAQLTWSKPDSSAVDYEIYRADETLTVSSLIKTTSQTRFDDVFDGGNNTFAYYVFARNAKGVRSGASNIVFVQQLSTANRPSPGQID